MSWLSRFASLVGLPERLAEDALHSERAAQHTLSRRGMLLGGAAMATGAVFSFPAPEAPRVFWYRADCGIVLNGDEVLEWRSLIPGGFSSLYALPGSAPKFLRSG